MMGFDASFLQTWMGSVYLPAFFLKWDYLFTHVFKYSVTCNNFGSVHRSCYKWDGDVENMGMAFAYKIHFALDC